MPSSGATLQHGANTDNETGNAMAILGKYGHEEALGSHIILLLLTCASANFQHAVVCLFCVFVFVNTECNKFSILVIVAERQDGHCCFVYINSFYLFGL